MKKKESLLVVIIIQLHMSDATFAHLHLLLIRFFIDCISAENIENSLANVFLLPSSCRGLLSSLALVLVCVNIR